MAKITYRILQNLNKHKYLKRLKPYIEEAAKEGAQSAIHYAVDILKARFPEGEAMIYHSPYIAYYAINAVKGRWPEGESKMLEGGRPSECFSYARDAIRGPWPEAEPMIARDEHYAYYYATQLLNLNEEDASAWGKEYRDG